VRYSLVNQSLSLDPALMDCVPPHNCVAASAEVKQAVLDGPTWVSTAGTTFLYSTLDNPKNPHEGWRVEVKQDVAGLGGNVDFYKSTDDVRYYHDFGSDLVGIARGQSELRDALWRSAAAFCERLLRRPAARARLRNGFGPRDLTPGTTFDNIGGSKYWATTAELQSPIPWLPPDFALKAAVFSDAGSLWGYRGQTSFPTLSQSLHVADSRQVRSSIGAGLSGTPFSAAVDYAYPTTKAPTTRPAPAPASAHHRPRRHGQPFRRFGRVRFLGIFREDAATMPGCAGAWRRTAAARGATPATASGRGAAGCSGECALRIAASISAR
jgi:outer membrane protein insertion porin family